MPATNSVAGDVSDAVIDADRQKVKGFVEFNLAGAAGSTQPKFPSAGMKWQNYCQFQCLYRP